MTSGRGRRAREVTGRAGRVPARVGAAAALTMAALVLLAGPAAAHPLGDFTANTAARLVAAADGVRIDYALDLAEIPTVQARRTIDRDRDGELAEAEAAAWRSAECRRIAEAQRLSVAGTPAPVSVTAATLSFPEGRAGLLTTRLECVLQAATGRLPAEATVEYEDTSRHDRIGWREVTAVGDGTRLLASDVPTQSTSGRLTAYPEELLAAPLRVTAATLRVDPSGGPAGPPPPVEGGVAAAGPFGGVADAFTDLVARQDLSPAFALLAVAVALGVGALHAAAPGHGKTVMAAYLVAERGQLRQALMLGTLVSATHTLGVLLLGLAVSVSGTLAPERLYRPLGIVSGLLFVVLGVVLLRRALGRRGHSHDHGPGGHHRHDHGPDGTVHTHAHADAPAPPTGDGAIAVQARPAVDATDHDHDHDHDDDPDEPGHRHGPPARIGVRGMVLPGLAGGMVPTPSALVVLLGGVALGRAWFGVLLVLAYGFGMAAALVAAGFLLQRARDRFDRRAGTGTGRLARLAAALPVASAAAVIVAGAVVVTRAALA